MKSLIDGKANPFFDARHVVHRVKGVWLADYEFHFMADQIPKAIYSWTTEMMKIKVKNILLKSTFS